MTPATLHGWISEMENIEDYYSRWGTDLEKVASSPGIPLRHGDVPKDKRRKADLLKLLPAIAATAGGALAFKKYRGTKDLLKNMYLYSGSGATTGWLPLVYRDAFRTVQARKSK